MRDYLSAVRGLTVRGCAFLAAGGASVVAAVVIGEQDLIAVALLLAGLPLLAAAAVARTRYRLACTRRLEPGRVTAGDTVSVRIRLDNVSRLRSSVLRVEDVTPHLGHRARFVVDRIEPGGSRDLSYSMRAETRGRYQVGPLTIRLTDPFGLCELERSFRSKDDLTVAPALERLPLVPPVGLSALNNKVRRATVRIGDEESSTRPYHSGDDLRKVHWKNTARLGELMVRRDERPLTGAAAVLLDTRAGAWPQSDHPDDPFSRAVSTAGSIAVNLARSGYGVRLITDSRVAATGPGNAVGALLDQLAVIMPAPVTALNPALALLRSAEHSGLVVAVLGRTDQATASLVAGARPRNAPAIAVLVDTARGDGTDAPAVSADIELSRSVLSRHGWTVLVADRTTRLADTWPAIFRPGAANGQHHLGSPGTQRAGAQRAGARGSDDAGVSRVSRAPRVPSAAAAAGPEPPRHGNSGPAAATAATGAAPADASGRAGPAGSTTGIPRGKRTPPSHPAPTGPLYRPGSPHEPPAPATVTGGPTAPAGRGC
ncbi:DUF58 domain-containing protein [Parafrankia elaeagni]|uniref:DUF58 domain-containing protein n=1 Tax=Parafrankia elaeagni TaxID=222534 RepID=UPI000367AAFA|nr:DUF58 domain-containing protein [Parafrankia elaeagni]